MALAVHVNGPALIYCRDPGGATIQGALELVGVAEEGVDISINEYDEPIRADTGGMRLPIDIMEMGKDANIRFRLPVYDKDLVSKYLRKTGDEANEGELPTLGLPIGLSGNAIGLAIQSVTDEPWRFYCCRPRTKRNRVRTGTTVYDCDIYAWALIGTSLTPKGAKLYDHVFA